MNEFAGDPSLGLAAVHLLLLHHVLDIIAEAGDDFVVVAKSHTHTQHNGNS